MKAEVEADWKRYFAWLLKNRGGDFFLHCNFDPNESVVDPFYKDVLRFWSELKDNNSVIQNGSLFLWNNRSIKVDSKSVFYEEYFSAGISVVSDLYICQTNTNSLKFWKERGCKIGNFLKWTGLRVAAHEIYKNQNAREAIHEDKCLVDTIRLTISKEKTCKLSDISTKLLYCLFVKPNNCTPSSFLKLQDEYKIDENMINWSFSN